MTTIDTQTLTRRDFLKGSGVAALALCGLTVTTPAAASGEAVDDDAFGMLIDITRCQGCNSCVLACQKSNDLAPSQEPPTCLDCRSYSFIKECTATTAESEECQRFVKRQCMHCLEPGCVSVCTVGALRKTPEGPVVYDSDKCIGCRYCQYACPFGVPAYEWNNPLGLIHKCEMCFDRLQAGEQPACVEACPTGAIQFGRRKDLLMQAHARINFDPQRYVHKVYGEHEAGGASVLYLSDVPFAELGLPTLSNQAVPHYAEAVMTKTPVVALSVAALATGLHFTRKDKAHTAADSADHTAQEDAS